MIHHQESFFQPPRRTASCPPQVFRGMVCFAAHEDSTSRKIWEFDQRNFRQRQKIWENSPVVSPGFPEKHPNWNSGSTGDQFLWIFGDPSFWTYWLLDPTKPPKKKSNSPKVLEWTSRPSSPQLTLDLRPRLTNFMGNSGEWCWIMIDSASQCFIMFHNASFLWSAKTPGKSPTFEFLRRLLLLDGEFSSHVTDYQRLYICTRNSPNDYPSGKWTVIFSTSGFVWNSCTSFSPYFPDDFIKSVLES